MARRLKRALNTRRDLACRNVRHFTRRTSRRRVRHNSLRPFMRGGNLPAIKADVTSYNTPHTPVQLNRNETLERAKKTALEALEFAQSETAKALELANNEVESASSIALTATKNKTDAEQRAKGIREESDRLAKLMQSFKTPTIAAANKGFFF